MKSKHIILLHCALWLIVTILNFSFLFTGSKGIPTERYIALSAKTIIEAGSFYIFYFFLGSRLRLRSGYLKSVLIFILLLVVYFSFYAFTLSAVYIQLKIANNWEILKDQCVVASYYTIFYAIIGSLFRMTIDGITSHQQKNELEKQNSKNELALLRSQINPHFLFNTLNTIHSQIISNNRESANAVIKLSDIMRYMLYDASKELITLEKELEYIDSYLKLQDLRLEKEGLVDIKITGVTNGILIPPMLLTPFIENAFKHGSFKTKGYGVRINVDIRPESLQFDIWNRCKEKPLINADKESGSGLRIVRRRLELLFPHKHTLRIIHEKSEFSVKLKIELQ